MFHFRGALYSLSMDLMQNVYVMTYPECVVPFHEMCDKVHMVGHKIAQGPLKCPQARLFPKDGAARE